MAKGARTVEVEWELSAGKDILQLSFCRLEPFPLYFMKVQNELLYCGLPPQRGAPSVLQDPELPASRCSPCSQSSPCSVSSLDVFVHFQHPLRKPAAYWDHKIFMFIISCLLFLRLPHKVTVFPSITLLFTNLHRICMTGCTLFSHEQFCGI